MAAAENKAVITSFVEEVINQGRFERVNDLVALNFVELDPLPGQQQGRERLKQVIAAFPDISLGDRGGGGGKGTRCLTASHGVALIAGNSSAFLAWGGR